MILKRRFFQLTVFGLQLALGVIVMNASADVQERPGHKFYLDGKVKKADGRWVPTPMIVGDKDSEGRYTIFNDIWEADFGVQTHYHATHFETFYLISGEAEWVVNGEAHKMKAGDAVYIPANAPHSARTLGNKPAHFILIYSAGDYEAHLEREASYPKEQLTDPKIQAMLRKLNDFNVVEKK